LPRCHGIRERIVGREFREMAARDIDDGEVDLVQRDPFSSTGP